MPRNPTDAQAEAAVVLEVASRASGLTRERLYVAVCADLSPEQVDAAVESLVDASVLRATPKRVYASDALRRVDDLGLICV
jgi:hypothetical protein